MEGKRFIHKIKLQNFLSYGSEGEEIELQPLNVLIGPNGSGKSNLIEAIGILKAIPTDLSAPFRQGGGINEFLWKGNKDTPIAEIKITVDYPQKLQSLLLDYTLSFTTSNQRFDLVDEFVEPETRKGGFQFYYLNNCNGFRSFTVRDKDPLSGQERRSEQLFDIHSINSDQSVLSQIKDPNRYPELYYLSQEFSKLSLYRYWQMGRHSEPRKSQPTDLPLHPLLEDGSNLGLVLKALQRKLGQRKLIEYLEKFYEEAEELDVSIYGGTVQIFIREKGLIQPIPATRLSDGTLRYLFLMALLLDPTPPPLICIEEPELGLHPDILPTIAELLIEASQRTQLIVTTHSDSLVSALSEYPESVIVCERDNTGTHLKRLKPEKLKKWLEKYTLGDLWRIGEIGGNRW